MYSSSVLLISSKLKTKEMIVDYRERRTEHAPILIKGAVVEQVESFKFLGVHITNKLSWSKYSCTIESILTGCITAWYSNCSASDHKALQRVVHTAQYITGAKLPAIQDFYTRRCQRKCQILHPPQSWTVLYATARQAVPECQV